ncbi:transglutaminase family protein [Thermodesulfobacteriota bacterium]
MNRLFGGFKFGWAAAITSGLIFMGLFFIRIGLFRNDASETLQIRKAPDKDIWMSILHQEKKIGYSHRRMTHEKGEYLLSETAFLSINIMGLVQDIQILTTGKLKNDFSLTSFTFELQSNLFNFKTHGKVNGNELTVFLDQKPISIAIDEPLYLAAGLLDGAWLSDLKPNQTRTFSVFDPSFMGKRPVHVTLVGNDRLTVMGKQQETKKISIDFMGNKQTAWIGRDGNVVKEKGFMGLTLMRVSKAEARQDLTASRDLTRTVAVAVNRPIDGADQLQQLRLRIEGVDIGRIFLNGGRQVLTNDELTINKESLKALSGSAGKVGESYLKPTPFIQSDHPLIKQMAAEIIIQDDPPMIRAKKLVAWVHRHIEKRPVLSVPNALETLKNRIGDCNEHAVLLAALSRACGIPAQVEAGLVYMKGRFYYHAWNVLLLGDWITADGLMGQMPADVTHIRFVRGEPSKQLDLMSVMGKVKLDILEQKR